MTNDGRGRPGLLLIVMIPLAIAVQGVAMTVMYPGGWLFVWIPSFLLGLAIAGVPIVLASPKRLPKFLAVACAGVVLAQAVSAFAAVTRAAFILGLWGRPGWSALASPEQWPDLIERVTRLPICCARFDRIYTSGTHWLFLWSEQAATLGGALFVTIYLFRRRDKNTRRSPSTLPA